MYKRILQSLVKNFFVTKGRAPSTAMEWAKLRARARALAGETPDVTRKTTQADLLSGPHISRGGPKGDRIWDFSQKKGEVIPFPDKGIRSLIKKGDVQVGTAPKTTQGILDAKKDRGILLRDSEEGIARIKSQNREAIKRFKEKNPDKFQYGGIAPLVGEPSYAADFYDDRTPMKRGKKVKQKKKRVDSIAEVLEGLSPKEKKIMKKMLSSPRWRQLPHGRQRYRSIKDLPEGILELLQKDPGFDRENFEKAYWAGEDFRWTDPGWSEGMRGQYSPMTGNIELNLSPFGEEAYPHWKLRSPHQDPSALKDVDKAKIALHELRHKNIMEDQNLFKTQPEWVQRSEGAGYLPKGGVTGHELYNRFLDKRFYPPEEDPGPNDPYFDKILKDYWEPYAQDYEKTAKRRLSERHGEGIETLAAQGGRIPYLKGKIVKGIKTLLKKKKPKVKKTVPEVSGIDDALKSDFDKAIGKKVDKNRKLTDEEWRDYVEENSYELGPYEEELTGNETIAQLDDMIAESRAYEADMYRQYKRGDLEKYVKPEVLEESRLLRQKKIDNVLDKAYDEIAGGSGFSGDYKLDADVLADSIAEQLGKGEFTDLSKMYQTDIYNTALNRMTKNLKAKMDFKKGLKDVEQKIELQMFDPKDRLPNQSGGSVNQEALIQMYLEEGLSYDEAVAAAQAASGLDMDILKDEKAKGGRAGYIFGGSAGLRALIKRLRGTNKRLFPSRPMEGIEQFMSPTQKTDIKDLKLKQLENLLEAAKIDKETLAHSFKVKKMNDPGLDFLMGKLDEAGLKAKNIDKYTNIDKDIMDVEMMIKNYTEKKLKRRPNAEGGITRAGFPFGGLALKAIRNAMRANKTWGVGGPPYKPEATSFDIKALTKKNIGQEYSLKELKELSESPLGGFASRGQHAPPKFEEFSKEFKNIKARILKEKLNESKKHAEATIESAKMVPAENATAKKVQAQFTREGKIQLEEAKEGLKEIDIYMGMLQKKGRSVHAEGGRIGYAGGGQTGLPAVTMGLPQGPGMQQPQMPAGPQPAGIPGGTIVAQNQMQQAPWMGSQMNQGIGGMPPGGMPQRGQPRPGGMPRPMAAEGGIMRMPFGLGSMSRRAFLKMMAAAGTLPFIGKGISKVAPEAIKETTEVITRGADGMPAYLTDLIEVVKAKGTRDVIEGFKKSDYSTVHRYKGVEVIDDSSGAIRIKKPTEGVATDASTGKMHEGISKEIEMEIIPGEYIQKGSTVSDDAAKAVKAPDEYFEGTVRPDREGKMKDIIEEIDDVDHLELKKIADEIDTLEIQGADRFSKASGGLAYALGE